MPDPNNILAQLPHMSWRGVSYPVVDRTHTFAFDTAEHKVIYRDGVATEMMGEQGRVFRYSIPMRESITTSDGLKQLFSRGFRPLYEAYRDPAPGMLVDPLHGAIQCTPSQWEDHLIWSVQDGVDVRLSFVEYTPIGKQVQDQPPTFRALFEITTALDAEVAAAPWTKQVPSPAPTTDPLSLAAGLINQVNVNRNRARAAVMRVSNRMAKVERAAEDAGGKNAPDPLTAAVFNRIRLDARHGRLASERLANTPPRDTAKTVVQMTVDTPKTIMQAAAELGMTVTEFLAINADLARNPLLPVGVRFWGRRKNAY